MSLYLCGGGSGKQIFDAMLKFSNEINKNKPILYVPLAMDENKYDSCYKWFESEIKQVGLKEFEMVRSKEELSKKDFSSYSAIFIGGGNTYKLLSDIKACSNYEKIVEYIKNGGTVFGGSAGAIIFGKDIDCCKKDDKNKIGLKDTTGFNYLNDYSILCHLKNKNLKRNRKFLEELSKIEKILYLPEEDVIVINNGKISMIGTKKYMVFKNGQYEYHSFANLKKDMIN